MRLLLDTHVLLWWLADDRRLSAEHRVLIADASNVVLVSAMTIAEIAIKTSLGKLEAPDDLPDHIEAQGFGWLPVGAEHAWRVRDLPPHHRDPFDRMLIAQAIAEQLTVLTADPHFAAYGVELG